MKKYQKSLDLFFVLSYNNELLMMMGDFAPFFRKQVFKTLKKALKIYYYQHLRPMAVKII